MAGSYAPVVEFTTAYTVPLETAGAEIDPPLQSVEPFESTVWSQALVPLLRLSAARRHPMIT